MSYSVKSITKRAIAEQFGNGEFTDDALGVWLNTESNRGAEFVSLLASDGKVTAVFHVGPKPTVAVPDPKK